RYGGGDIPATLGGLLAAIGTFVVLGGLITAGAGNIAYQVGVLDIDGNVEELSIAGAVASIVVLFVSFFVGGWVASRMARIDGARNGIIVALWMTVLVVVFGAAGIWAGAEYNILSRLDLPDWVSHWDNSEVTTATSVLASIAALVTYAGGYLGGLVGDIYNTRANSAMASASPEQILN
ncbi:MAG: hypothetical protein KJN71_09085, partial [Acidimicrobiia bacterium]|nr:hypothetical protein [Acidimicrobiia bacterium]